MFVNEVLWWNAPHPHPLSRFPHMDIPCLSELVASVAYACPFPVHSVEPLSLHWLQRIPATQRMSRLEDMFLSLVRQTQWLAHHGLRLQGYPHCASMVVVNQGQGLVCVDVDVVVPLPSLTPSQETYSSPQRPSLVYGVFCKTNEETFHDSRESNTQESNTDTDTSPTSLLWMSCDVYQNPIPPAVHASCPPHTLHHVLYGWSQLLLSLYACAFGWDSQTDHDTHVWTRHVVSLQHTRLGNCLERCLSSPPLCLWV